MMVKERSNDSVYMDNCKAILRFMSLEFFLLLSFLWGCFTVGKMTCV